MTSYQPTSKPAFTPVTTGHLISSLPAPATQAAPEISEESSLDQVDLKVEAERAGRLGHHMKYISPVDGVPPLQSKPELQPQEQNEEEAEEAPVQRKESASAPADPSQPGSSDAPTPPGSPDASSGAGAAPQPSLQAQLERAEQLGHHFSKVPVLSNPAQAPQAQPMYGWVQRACSQCQQEEEDLGVQAQLTIGQPGDPYEVEADQVAAQVMSMPDPQPQQPGIQAQPMAEIISQVRRSAQGAAQASSGFESRLSSAKGGGSPLPESVQSFMGSRLGADLTGVRVHTDSASVQMNQEIGAQAFTHGSDVFYGAGKGPANDHLTAHELTHTIQQGAVVRAKADGDGATASGDQAGNKSNSGTDHPEVDGVVDFIHREMITNVGGADVAFIRDKLTRGFWELVGTAVSPIAGLTDQAIDMAQAYVRFFQLVVTGGDWDHKNEIISLFTRWTQDQSSNLLFSYDIWSNIHYGYVGLAAGFSKWELLSGAGIAQQLAGTVPDGYWKRRLEEIGDADVFIALDDPKDQAAVHIGFDLWERFGTGVTANNILSSVRGGAEGLATRPLRG